MKKNYWDEQVEYYKAFSEFNLIAGEHISENLFHPSILKKRELLLSFQNMSRIMNKKIKLFIKT